MKSIDKNGWVKLEDLNSNSAIIYYDQSTCEKINGICIKRPQGYEGESGIFKENEFNDVLVDDLSNPIFEITHTVSCGEEEESCEILLETLEVEQGIIKEINEEGNSIICKKIIGYEKRFSHREAVVDQDLVNGKNLQEQQEEEIKLSVLKGEMIKSKCEKAISLILSHNSEFTFEQIDQLEQDFGEIYNCLMRRRIDKAYMLISQTEPTDLISQEFLDLLKQTLIE